MRKNCGLFLMILVFLVMGIPSVLLAQIDHSVVFFGSDLTFTDETAKDSVTYTKVSMPELQMTDGIGAPSLPVYYFNLIVPSGHDVEEVVLDTIEGEEIDGSYLIYPTQVPIPTCIDCEKPEFVGPDSGIYGSDEPYPAEIVRVVHQGYFDGGTRIIRVAVCPLQYHPQSGSLRFFSSVGFTLEMEPGETEPLRVQQRLETSQFTYNEVLKNLVENDQDIPAYQVLPLQLVTEIQGSKPLLPTYEYVIITTPSLAPAFNDFVTWRNTLGIGTGVVTIDDITAAYPNGDDRFPNSIVDGIGGVRTYLFEAWQNGTVWALLAGPPPDVPYRYGWAANNTSNWWYIIPTDLYVADFNGDWDADGDGKYGEPTDDIPDYNCEMFVGRLLTADPADVPNWISKVLRYEQYPGNGDFSYLIRSFITQADEMQQGQKAQAVCPHLPPAFTHTIWEEWPSYNSTPPSSPFAADVIAEMNKNYGLLGSFNHGGTNLGYSTYGTMTNGVNGIPNWCVDAEDNREYPGEQPEQNDGFDNLTNVDYPSVFYSISCTNAPFDRTKAYGNSAGRNIGESYTVNTPAGGVAYLGNTRYGWVTSSTQLYIKFADLLTSAGNDPSTGQSYSHLGVAEFGSKALHHNLYLAYSHNLLGGPWIRMWTDIPSYLNVSHPLQVPVSAQSIFPVSVEDQGNPVENAYVWVSGPGVRAAGFTDIGGAFSVAASPTGTGLIRVAVTKHNYIPWVSYGKACRGYGDILIRDFHMDLGIVPSFDVNRNNRCDGMPPDEIFWASPNITIDTRPWGSPDPNPEYGEENRLYASAINIGPQALSNVIVDYYWADPGIGLVFPDDWHLIGSKTITSLAPGVPWSDYVAWWPPAPGHYCTLVRLNCYEDPIVNDDPPWDNNVAMKNFFVQDLRWRIADQLFEGPAEFRVKNPGSEVSDVRLSLFQEPGWPSGWGITLSSPDSFVQVDSNEYLFPSMDSLEERSVGIVVMAPEGSENDTGTVHFMGTTDDGSHIIGGISMRIVPPTFTNVLIPNTEECVNPGDHVCLPILLDNNTTPFGGFELEIEFDYTAMTFVGAEPGELIEGFEKFTYRLLPCPACGCCKYKTLLFGMYDIPNGVENVGDPIPMTPLGEFKELVNLCFVVNNDENLRGLKIPVCWEWEGTVVNDTLVEDWECAENTFSSWSGDTLFASNLLCQFNPDICDDPTDRIQPILIFQHGICGQNCGGIDVCPAGPGECKRGDINMNDMTHEVADAVLLASYFVEGTVVFRYDEAYQICATDVNADGRTLTLSDLVYLIRVILHDAVEIPKLTPSSEVANVIVSGGTISTECAAPIGAILFEFDGVVNPTLLADMEMLHKDNKVLVWSSKGKSFSTGQVLTFEGDAELVTVTAVDRDSRELSTTITGKVAPPTFALHPAYPNPFNPFTTLSYTLPENVDYSLRIYNVAGQLVRTYEGLGSVGLNMITWDSKDNTGVEVASGVYFYKLTAGGFSATEKMVILK